MPSPPRTTPPAHAQHLAFGVGAALWFVYAVACAVDLGPRELALLAAPVLALELIALLYTRRAGLARRLVGGALGLLTSAAAATLTIAILRELTDWYDFPADTGGDLFLLMLLLLAALPGMIAASCGDLRRGLALSGGFCGTLITILLALAAKGSGAEPWGLVVILLVGPVVGAPIGALLARSPTRDGP